MSFNDGECWFIGDGGGWSSNEKVLVDDDLVWWCAGDLFAHGTHIGVFSERERREIEKVTVNFWGKNDFF